MAGDPFYFHAIRTSARVLRDNAARDGTQPAADDRLPPASRLDKGKKRAKEGGGAPRKKTPQRAITQYTSPVGPSSMPPPPPPPSRTSNRPLFQNVFHGGFDPLQVLNFESLSIADQGIIDKMSPTDEFSALFELQASASLLAKDLGDKLALRAEQMAEADKLKEELEESARNLQKALEANGELSARVAELEAMAAQVGDLKAKLQAAEEEGAAKDHKLAEQDEAMRQYKSKVSAIVKRLRDEWDDLKAKVEEVTKQGQNAVVRTHLEAFNKAIRQARFFGFDPKDFNVDFDVHNGQMVPIEELPEGFYLAEAEESELPKVTLDEGGGEEQTAGGELEASVQGEEDTNQGGSPGEDTNREAAA